jgi:hypothetical protein
LIEEETPIATKDISKGEPITPKNAKGIKSRGAESDDDKDFDNKLKNIFKQDYAGFVAALGKFAGDPKFQEFVKSDTALKSTVKLTQIPVTKLKPTQNEIDVDKSLAFPLKKPDAAKASLKGGAVKVQSPIITFNGEYIVDGHHRWSQVYALNREANIVAYNFTNPDIKSPLDALKLTQLAIVGAGASKIPSAKVEGKNLLKMGEADVKQYVINNLKDPEGVEVFKTAKKGDTKEAIADYIWSNVDEMKKTSQPVSGAPGRGIMPQADDVPGGQQKTVDTLKKGVPSINEERQRFKKIAGINKR